VQEAVEAGHPFDAGPRQLQRAGDRGERLGTDPAFGFLGFAQDLHEFGARLAVPFEDCVEPALPVRGRDRRSLHLLVLRLPKGRSMLTAGSDAAVTHVNGGPVVPPVVRVCNGSLTRVIRGRG
jgi:hypothetical protein